MLGKKIYYFSLIAVLAVALAICFFNKSETGVDGSKSEGLKKQAVESDTVLFCSQLNENCVVLEKYIAQEKIDQMIGITRKDIMDAKNPENAKELELVGTGCGLEKRDIGNTPLLFAQGKCYIGVEKVKEFFKDKLGK